MATAITIGNFDGVHAGHAALVRRARELAGPDGRVVVLSFDPHPASVLRPGDGPARLSGFDRRSELLGELGADEVVRLEPSEELLALEPLEFLGRVDAEHAPAWIVEGADFRFGRRRTGDVSTLRELGGRLGFDVEIVRPVRVGLTDQSVVVASSTLTRWLVERGRVRDASIVLGRPHLIEGEVVRGDRLGRTLGFPTANVSCETLAPADGVYAGLAHLPDGRGFPAAISVGTREMFDGSDRRIEAHLLGVEKPEDHATIPGLPEYGWRIRLGFISWLRDQSRFASVEALIDQIHRDCTRTLELLSPEIRGIPAGRSV